MDVARLLVTPTTSILQATLRQPANAKINDFMFNGERRSIALMAMETLLSSFSWANYRTILVGEQRGNSTFLWKWGY